MNAFCLIITFLSSHAYEIAASTPTSGRKISVVSALLPTTSLDSAAIHEQSRSAQLRIEAFGGCYTWESSHPELVAIEPLSEGSSVSQKSASCQRVAIVRSIADGGGGERQKALVFARDINDPDVELRCEVYVSNIDHVAIETSARSFNVGDVLELSVKAYDAQGNVFSSLEGLPFDWHIKDQSILRSPYLAETAFQLSPARRSLAQKDLQSDMLLIRGVSIGETTVSVALPGKKLRSQEISLTVKEQILLVPSSVRLPPMAQLQLRLRVGSKQLLDAPSVDPNFRWSWESMRAEGSAEVLFPPSQSGHVVAQDLGSARVIVNDERIQDSSAFVDIRVKEPDSLSVTPLMIVDAPGVPEKNEWDSIQRLSTYAELQLRPWTWNETGWLFVKGRRYLLRLSLLDSRKDALFVPPNLRVNFGCKDSDANECPLDILQKTSNSQVIMFRAGRVGSGAISYGDVSVSDELQGSYHRSWPKLMAEFNFQISEPLHLNTPFSGPLVLPPQHVFALEVTGGSGVYVFKAHSKLCKVSSSGVVESLSALGNTKVEVFDAKNMANSISLVVFVRHPGVLLLRPLSQFQLSDGEASMHVPVFAQPEALAEDDDPEWPRLRFWSCSAFKVQVSADHSEVAEVTSTCLPTSSQDGFPGACCVITVLPKSAGSSALSASLITTGIQGQTIRLEASSRLQVYAPLALSFREYDDIGDEKQSEAHISPCSSATLVLHGGPFSVKGSGQASQNLFSDFEGTHLRLRSLGKGTFEIMCLKTTPGRVQIFAEVKQDLIDSAMHGGTVVARSSAWVKCTAPMAASVIPRVARNGALVVQSTSKRGTLGLRLGQRHQFGVSFLDEDGGQLVTSPIFTREWRVEYSDANTESVPLKTEHADISAPSGASPGDSIKLTVTVSLPDISNCLATYGLEGQYAEALREGVANLSPPTPDTLHLRMTADLVVRWPGYPSRHFAFAPAWAFMFEAAHGSGEVSLRSNSSSVSQVGADSICHAASSASSCLKVVSVSPSMEEAMAFFLQPSSPGYFQVIVEDNNQIGVSPSLVDVTFLPVSRISIALSDVQGKNPTTRLLIVRGRQHPLTVELWDSAGHPLSSSNWEALDLVVAASDASLVVTAKDGSFVVSGSSLGSFELQATARNHPNTVVYSNTLRVHIFDMLSIAPSHAVILPGQTFEFTLQGGAAAGAADSAKVQFSSSNPEVAQVQDNGLIFSASVGSANITARLVEAETGRELTTSFSEVIVALPNNVVIAPMEYGGKECTSGPLLVRGSLDPLRLVASLSSDGTVLTQHLLTPMQGRSSSGCRFSWSSDDSSISLVPVGDSNLAGAGVVDAFAADMTSSGPVGSAKLSVLVECPNVRRLEAFVSVPVAQHLRLVAPVIEHGSSASLALLRIHPFARVALSFSQPQAHLKITLSDTGASSEPLTRIDHRGQSVELVAGHSEGEALAVVSDQRLGSSLAPLMVTIAVRAAHGLYLSPALPRRLMLHSIAEVTVQLRDQTGAALALSSEAHVKHSVSHPSILESLLTDAPTGGKILRLKAIKEGCAAVNVSTEMPCGNCAENASLHVLSDVAFVCVSRGALMGHRESIIVQPGAALHFASDGAMAKGEEDSLSFSIRFHLAPMFSSSTSSIGKELASDLSRLLHLPDEAVSVLEIRWNAITEQPGSSIGFDANVRILLKFLPTGFSLPDVAQQIWFHQDLADFGSVLKYLDLAYGLRAPYSTTMTSRILHSPFLPSVCSGREGLSSSDPQVLTVAESEAIAKQVGEAKARICFGAVATDADIVVTNIVAIRTEIQSSGPYLPSLHTNTTVSSAVGARVTNKAGMGPLVVLARFFAQDGAEILSGPFHVQNIDFTCSAEDPLFDKFFTFEPWQAFSASSSGLHRPDGLADNSSLRLPWGRDAAQAACVLHPKKPDVRELRDVFAPSILRLKVHTQCTSCAFAPSTVVDWSFVPEFIPFDAEGKRLGLGKSCGTLTFSKPTLTFSVWTGGYAVEATLGRQLQRHSRGVLAVHVSDSDEAGTAPTITMTLVWDDAVEFGSAEEIDLRLESRVGGQTHLLKVRVDGARVQDPVTLPVLPAGRFPYEVLLILLFIGCPVLFIFGRSSFGGAPTPAIAQPATRVSVPPQASISSGQSPFVAMPQRGGVSPFRCVSQY